MFRVNVKTDGTEYPLYEPLDESLRIFEPVLSEEMGGAGSFQFQISRDHSYYDRLKPLRSEIILYQDDEAIFIGRLMKPSRNFDNMVTLPCEGILTYLLDSQQRPVVITGNLQTYIAKLLEIHNGQVEQRKRVEVGSIVVTGGNDKTVREITEFTPTLTALRQLADQYGGFFRLRRAGGKNVLDYVWDYGAMNSQIIRFGENLLDLEEQVDASNIITCLIPQGGEVEYQDELGETQTRTVDIVSVNNGKDYIVNEAAVAAYGQVWGYQKFEDVTDQNVLLEKAKIYLEEASALPSSLQISAVDLAVIDASTESFRVGCWTQVLSEPHGIEQNFILTKREINLLDPTQGSITLGREVETMTDTANRTQAEISERVDKIVDSTSKEIQRKIENATTLITGGFGGYVVLDNIDPATGKKMHPWRILVMNTPDKDTAKNVIQINQNGIGFSTTGINGPYSNAWTIDGNLVADFITTGTMLADRIRGGTLEVGGSGLGKDGMIRVLDAKNKEIVRMDKSGVTIYAGKLNAPDIVGGTAEFGDGLFYADDEEVSIGGFYARYGWGRDIFQSFDGQCGMSAAASGKGKLWFWAGYNSENDYDFLVNNLGEVHCRELYIESNDDYWQGWNLSDTLRDLDSKYKSLSRDIDDLQDQIDNIDTGGGTV